MMRKERERSLVGGEDGETWEEVTMIDDDIIGQDKRRREDD